MTLNNKEQDEFSSSVFFLNKMPSCPQIPALKSRAGSARQNEVRSLCLQHIMNSSAITAFPAEVCWAWRRRVGGWEGYKWKKMPAHKGSGSTKSKGEGLIYALP